MCASLSQVFQQHRRAFTHSFSLCVSLSEIFSISSFPGGTTGKESTCQCRDMDLIPESGRPPGGGHGNPLQYSCLGNPTDRGAWWAPVHSISKSQTQLSTELLKSFLLLPGFLLLHTPVLPIINSFSPPWGSDHDLYHSLWALSLALPSSLTQPRLFPRDPMTVLLAVSLAFKLCKPSSLPSLQTAPPGFPASASPSCRTQSARARLVLASPLRSFSQRTDHGVPSLLLPPPLRQLP